MKTKLISTQDYLLLIDEEAEIKGSPFLCYNPLKITWDDDVVLYQGAMPEYNYRGLQKIIAYYPLTKEAKELDLPLLPNPFEGVDVEKLACKKYDIKEAINDYDERYYNSHNVAKAEAFIEGYKAAQAKGQFSLEDMKKAIEMATHINPFDTSRFYSSEEIIQSLSTQRLPKEFIPSYKIDCVKVNCNGECGECNYMEKILKTITNSEGKEELVGTYKY